MLQIAKELSCSEAIIRKKLLKYNVLIRNRSELLKGKKYLTRGITLKLYYCKEEGCNKKIFWQTVIYGKGRCASCGAKFKLKNPRNHPMFGKIGAHGKWGIYKGKKMRSSYEIAYAKYLDKNNIKWLYESKTFDLGNTTYTPDFYLPEFNCYIEIKGYWRDNAKVKFKLFRSLYPEINIKLLMKPELTEMGAL